MADREEGLTSPDIDETEEARLRGSFGDAREAEAPLERTADDEGEPDERSEVAAAFDAGATQKTTDLAIGVQNQDGTVNVATEDGRIIRVNRNNINNEGMYVYQDGDDEGVVHVALQQGTMGDFWGDVLVVLSHLLGGRWGEMSSSVEMLFPREVYVDPNDREERISTLRDVAEDPEHPLRQAPPRQLVDRVFGTENLPALREYFGPLNSHFDRLLTTIASVESRGGDTNIIWDYRNRTDPGGNYPGLQPGDVTPGGLRVPDISKMTVNQVLAWQRQYLDEQVAAGIPADKRSSAAGSKQFTYTTLKYMRDEGMIAGDRVFNGLAQNELAIKRLLHNRDLNEFLSGDITVNQMIRNVRQEWEGASAIPTETLSNMLTEMKNTAQAQGFDNLSARSFSFTDNSL